MDQRRARLDQFLAKPGYEEMSAELPISSGQVRAVIQARRDRETLFGPELFADTAWDILLDLYLAVLEGRSATLCRVCEAAMVPVTTGLRWVKALEGAGLLAQTQGTAGPANPVLALSANGLAKLNFYFRKLAAPAE